MEYYAGIDVSLESATVCIVDDRGNIVREGKVASEPAALIKWLRDGGVELSRIGLEAGPMSQWLYAGMAKSGLAVELLETRHVRAAFRTMPVKTDRTDARGIAQLMRLGWFRSVHCKSLPSQEIRALLTARKLMQGKLHDVERSLRGILRGFGLKVGKTTPRTFEARILELVAGQSVLQEVADALLAARAVLAREFRALDQRIHKTARQDERVKLLMSVPGVASVVGMAFVATIDDPARFKSSKNVGAHFGLTPGKYQSGETDVTGRISKCGDAGMRALLFDAAHIVLTKPVKQAGALKRWAMALEKRAGRRKAKVALARRLAVIMHRMWVSGTAFDPTKAATARA
jgi:transposase